EPGILVAKAVMILAPDMRCEQIVEGRDRPPPRNAAAALQPFRVLIEHRIHDVNERLVAIEDAVPAGEEIAFEPALAGMLRQDLHHPTAGREMLVIGPPLGLPGTIGRLEHMREAIG